MRNLHIITIRLSRQHDFPLLTALIDNTQVQTSRSAAISWNSMGANKMVTTLDQMDHYGNRLTPAQPGGSIGLESDFGGSIWFDNWEPPCLLSLPLRLLQSNQSALRKRTIYGSRPRFQVADLQLGRCRTTDRQEWAFDSHTNHHSYFPAFFFSLS